MTHTPDTHNPKPGDVFLNRRTEEKATYYDTPNDAVHRLRTLKGTLFVVWKTELNKYWKGVKTETAETAETPKINMLTRQEIERTMWKYSTAKSLRDKSAERQQSLADEIASLHNTIEGLERSLMAEIKDCKKYTERMNNQLDLIASTQPTIKLEAA